MQQYRLLFPAQYWYLNLELLDSHALYFAQIAWHCCLTGCCWRWVQYLFGYPPQRQEQIQGLFFVGAVLDVDLNRYSDFAIHV